MMDNMEGFERIDLGDKDLERRFVRTLEQLGSDPQASIHRACGKESQSKAVYRMIGNEKLTERAIVETHHDVTMERIGESGARVVLIPQDTTEFNFSRLEKTSGLGSIGTDPALRGLIMHSAIGVSPQGQVFGLLHQKIWTRPPEEYGKKHKRKELPIEEKESYKWLETMEQAESGNSCNTTFVHVCDREGDLYEFFEKANREQRAFLCRRVHNRKVKETEKSIEEFLASQPAAGTYQVQIPRDSHTDREARTAEVEIRFGQAHVMCPQRHERNTELRQTLVLQMISAQEVNAPEGTKPVDWQLITNLAVNDFETARQYVQWYSRRWMIELFHRALKEGCAIEKLQSDTAERLSKLIEMYSIIAMRIMQVTYLARTDPDASCETVLTPFEWKVLYSAAKRTTRVPEKPPTNKEAAIMIAQLAGFSGYKSSGFPGIKVMWWGMTKLLTLLDALPFIAHFVG
jgi:hypothetical protein